MSWLGALPQGAFPAAQQPAQPFLWGGGGERMTPDEIAFQRRLAAQQTQTDFSPVSHWLQGAARLADNVAGRFREQRVEKAAERNAAEGNAVLQALMSGSGGPDAVTAALVNPYVNDEVRDFAKMQWQAQQPKQVAPHYWETNDGSLGVVGPDGKPSILYQDPTAKISWMTADNGDGTKTLVPFGPNGPLQQGGGGQVSPRAVGGNTSLPTAPVGKLTPIGGPTPRASAGFRP